MGFDVNGTRLLLKAKELGVNFQKTAMIGRQGLHLGEKPLAQNLKDFGHGHIDAKDILSKSKGYSEPFLEILGAKEIHSFDASDYENASKVHDMNRPIPQALTSSYSTVIDGGSLEHIFNFPVAIKNCMELLEVSGHYLGITPTNNFLGHGFYQFSPELYFRIFSENNGFEMVTALFYIDKKHKDDTYSQYFELIDPKELKQRVTLANIKPSYLFIMARKVSEKPIFATPPQQSDYEHISWKKDTAASTEKKQSIFVRGLNKLMPNAFQEKWNNYLTSSDPIGTADKRFFKPFEQ